MLLCSLSGCLFVFLLLLFWACVLVLFVFVLCVVLCCIVCYAVMVLCVSRVYK